MRRLLGISLAALTALSFNGPARGDDAAAARAIIDKAIKATGGASLIEKYQAFTGQEKGVYYGMGEGLPYTATYAMQHPDKFRIEIQGIFLMVFNGDKGWVKTGQNVMDMDADAVKSHKEERYAERVMKLVNLKDKAFTLSLLGETKVDDKPVVGVKVASQGHQDVNLFFDKGRGLILKAEYTVHSREHGYREVSQEVVYSDFKDIDGLQTAMKFLLKRDGKKFIESEVTDIKYHDKLDEKEFAKP